MRLLFFFVFIGFSSCSSQLDLPQHLAGTEVLQLTWAGKDTVHIRQKAYLRLIAKELQYKGKTDVLPSLPTDCAVRFFRQSSDYTLLAGKMKADYSEMVLVYKNTFLRYKINKKVRTLLKQARKYPTLLE